jgi:hypothetical protein
VDAPLPDIPPGPEASAPDLFLVDLPPPDTVGWDILTTTGKDYVVTRFVVPSGTSQVGVDFNGDGVVDNALGTILGSIGAMAPSMDLQEQIDLSVYSGSLLELFRVFAKDLTNDPGAVMQAWIGTSQTCCTSTTVVATCQSEAQQTCFNGSHSFTPDPTSPTNTVLAGPITAGKAAFKAKTMVFQLPLSTAGTVSLLLKEAHVQGDITASGITNGIVAGAIGQTDLQTKVIPAVATILNDLLQDPTVDPQTKNTVTTLFDTNGDNKIDATEVAGNSIIKMFLSGDVDVDGDGVKELSVGLGFTATTATITP